MTRPTRDGAIRAQRAAARPSRGRWPIPTDTPADRARTIGNGLLEALRKLDPEAAAEFVARAHGLGETWLGGGQLAADGPWLTRAEAATILGVTPGAVSMLTSRGRLTRHPAGYAARDVYNLRAGTPRPARPQEQEQPS